MSMLAPLKSHLPPPPSDDVFSPEQWQVMLSILDTFIPSITSSFNDKDSKLYISGALYAESARTIQDLLPSSIDSSIISTYLAESASSVQDFRPSLHRLFGQYVPLDQLQGLRFILSSLATRPGSLLLTGSTTPFHLQPQSTREKVLFGWSKSYLPTLRSLFRSLSGLAKVEWLALSPTLPDIIGFPAVPKHGKRGEDYPYQFVDFARPECSSTIQTDVVIVGSGCAAGVCAKNFAEAGFSVLVTEKGYHFPSTHYPMQGGDGRVLLMENGGAVVSDDGGTVVLAGSCFGGGGTVNWSASLQTQHYVRQEWADQGLSLFTSGEFQKCLDKVCAQMGVSTKAIQHNFANRTLMEGSRRLGYEAKEVPQNTGGREHNCGYCTYGCASATKNGPAVCFFPAAARAGAKFIEGFDVRHIEFEDIDGKKTAVGVKGTWAERNSENRRREITVKAKKVIICAGTLNSPLLLMRSGLTNPHIGRNLHLHPATHVGARFEEATNPWEGSILTSVCTSFENLDNRGHGCKIECQAMLPTYFLPPLPWGSSVPGGSHALTFKTRCASLHHTVGFVIICRDRDTGVVYADPTDGRARIKYSTSRFDAKHLVEGVIAAAKIAFVCGAREVYSFHPDHPPFVRRPRRPRTKETAAAAAAAPIDREEKDRREEAVEDAGEEEEEPFDDGINSPEFQSWLTQLRRLGIASPHPCTLGSAHQMGTCRMSASPNDGVVDPNGRVWGVHDGLYVADASVFPTASGVNPMVTTMGIAQWISTCIINATDSAGRARNT